MKRFFSIRPTRSKAIKYIVFAIVCVAFSFIDYVHKIPVKVLVMLLL